MARPNTLLESLVILFDLFCSKQILRTHNKLYITRVGLTSFSPIRCVDENNLPKASLVGGLTYCPGPFDIRISRRDE